MSISQTIAKNSLFNFISMAAEAVTVFAVGIMLARHLGTEQYGLYALMMWFHALAALVVSLGMTEMTKRFIGEAIGQQNMNTVKGLVRLNLLVKGAGALLTCGLIIILSGFLARLLNVPTDSTYFMLVAILLLPNTLVLTISGIFSGFQKYEYGAYVGLMINLFRFVAVIMLVFWGCGVKEVLIAYTAVWALGIPLAIFFLSRLVPLRDLLSPSLLQPQTRNSALKYSLAVLGIHGVDYFLWYRAEVMFLGFFRPVEEVGFYNIANKIPSTTMHLVPMAIGKVLLPTVAEQFGKGEIEKVKAIYVTSARYLMMLSFPIAVGGIVLAEPIINVLFGYEYAPSVVLMQIIFVPFALRGIYHSVTSIIYGLKEPGFILKTGIILICMIIGLNLWLVPQYGPLGAVIATSIPRMISLPVYTRFASKKLGASWPLGDTAKIALASVAMGLVVFILQYYTGDILSLSLGVPAGIIIYAATLLALGLVTPQDMGILKQAEKQLPPVLRKVYTAIVNFIGMFVRQAK